MKNHFKIRLSSADSEGEGLHLRRLLDEVKNLRVGIASLQKENRIQMEKSAKNYLMYLDEQHVSQGWKKDYLEQEEQHQELLHLYELELEHRMALISKLKKTRVGRTLLTEFYQEQQNSPSEDL